MKLIKLVNSTKTAKVDDDNFEAANEFVWFFDSSTGYAFRYIGEPEDGETEYMQDWVWKRMVERN